MWFGAQKYSTLIFPLKSEMRDMSDIDVNGWAAAPVIKSRVVVVPWQTSERSSKTFLTVKSLTHSVFDEEQEPPPSETPLRSGSDFNIYLSYEWNFYFILFLTLSLNEASSSSTSFKFFFFILSQFSPRKYTQGADKHSPIARSQA